MSTHKREVPLTAAPETTGRPTTQASLPGPSAPSEREERFREGVRTLRVGGVAVKLEERLLMVLGGIIAPVGIIAVLLGWLGASRTPHVFEQVPYLISGGLLGLALVFLGAFFYFAHWLTQLVKESRAQSAALLQAFERLQADVKAMSSSAAAVPGVVTTNGATPHDPSSEVLVATERGTMAHRPSCAVVSGRPGLRPVRAADGLAPCKLCDPYAS